jgi:HSP20 family protein
MYMMKLNNSLFNENFFDDFFKTTTSNMMYDSKENEKDYTLELALPGMSKDDIQIELEENYLKISSKKEHENEKEWYYQSFSKSVYIGDTDVDIENIKSTMDKGILKIVLPKKEKVVKKKFIEIN